MSDYKISQITELTFFLICSLFCIYFIVFLFPAPYFLIGDFSGTAAYDSEPDYFANILSFRSNGHPMDFLHPGIPISYLTGYALNLISQSYNVEEIIQISRSILLFLNFLFIYIGSRLILRQELQATFLILVMLFIFPAGFVLIDIVSPNSILFGLSVLIIALGSKLNNFNLGILLSYGFFLGFAVSLKYTAIILILPYFLSLFLSSSKILNFNTNKLMHMASIVVLFISSFTFFAWPIVPFIPFAITHHGLNISPLFLLLSNPVLIFTLGLSLLLLTYISRKIFKRYFNLNYRTIYFFVCFLICFFSIIIVLKNSFFSNSYLSYAYDSRDFLLLFGAGVLFIPEILKIKHSCKKLEYMLAILITCIGLKAFYNISMLEKAQKEELSFSRFVKNIGDYDFYTFYPPFSFASKDLFVAWADYRYGDSKKNFSSNENGVFINYSTNKYRILNSRKFNLPESSNKFFEKYLEFLLSNNLMSNSQKKVGLNQINLLKSKNICFELFDGFSENSSFVIIIPDGLSSYMKAANVDELKYGAEYAQSLSKELNLTCGMETKISHTNYGSQKMHLLEKL